MYAASPKGSAEGVLNRRVDEFTVLSFIARSSGNLAKSRKAVIASYLVGIDAGSTLEAVEVAVARYEFSQSEFRAALKRLAFADRENKDRLLLAVDRLRAIGAHNEFVAAAAKVAHKQLGSTG
jgi:hypothetical protein